MQIKTRIFGEVTIDDSKMIKFPNGIVGFPDLTDFALIHDAEQGDQAGQYERQHNQHGTRNECLLEGLVDKVNVAVHNGLRNIR